MCSGKNYHTKTKKKEMQFRTRNKMMKARTKKNTTQYNDSEIYVFLPQYNHQQPCCFPERFAVAADTQHRNPHRCVGSFAARHSTLLSSLARITSSPPWGGGGGSGRTISCWTYVPPAVHVKNISAVGNQIKVSTRLRFLVWRG